jgi:hypothetical protein
MPPTLDDRLRELAQATHDQLEPSPDLLGRIRTATRSHPRPAWGRPSVLVAAAAIVVAIAAAGVGLATRAPGRHALVSAAPVSRDQFIADANQACDALGTARAQNAVVFPTPDGYRAVATALIAAVQRELDQLTSASAAADAEPTVTAVTAHLRAALDQLRLVKLRATSANTSDVQGALTAAENDLNSSVTALGAYGATQCAPSHG